MKAKIAICIIVGLLPLLLALLTPCISASAQSGRIILTPTQSPELPEQSEAKSKFVVDPNADKYKLVFVPSTPGKRFYVGAKEEKEMLQASQAYQVNFINQLNQAGEQGYRLISTAGHGIFRVAIAKLAESQYEYSWFETTSNFFFAKTGFGEKYTELSNQGFSLAEHSFLSRNCDSPPYTPNSDFPVLHIETCMYYDLFLLEREKGVEISRKFTIARHIPRWRALKSDASLTTMINDYLTIGYYP
ncbi:MAG: hypothetical protein MN733_11115, partial [Nitrososphaera sp.]|nr:hypothetical protein [Nitrososphaera sp.]